MKLRSTLAVAVVSLLWLGGVAHAQFRWVDAEGRVHYSNVQPVTPTPLKAPEPAKSPVEATKLAPAPLKPPASAEALIEEVLDLSGTKKAIFQFPSVVRAQLAEREAEMRPADFERASQVIAEAYGAEELYASVVDTFKRRYDEPRLLAVADSLRSPLFRRITELELRATAPETLNNLRAFAARLRYDRPAPERLALVKRLDEAAGVTESNLEVMVATIRSIVTAIEPMLPASRRPRPGQLEQLLVQMKAQARPPLQNQLRVTLLYAYQPLTEGELAQYVAFYESETGRWYTRVAREGTLVALTAAARNAGHRMGKTSAAAAPQPGALARNGSAPVPAQKNWALAASAILTERNGQRHDLLGGSERTEANVKAWKQIMSDWWGINSRADLFTVLKWLDEGGHRQDFEQLAEFSRSLSPAQHKDLRRRLQSGDDDKALYQLAMVDKYADRLGKKSLLGWDYARYIALCRWGYLVGYLSEEEAWERILPAARTLQGAFDSWKDLGENYLIGREFWSTQQSQKDGHLHRAAFQKLLADPGSPWNRYAWELTLDPAAPARAARASR